MDGWFAPARAVRSPNFDQRTAGTEIDLIVIHHISLPAGYFAGTAIESLFCNTLDCNSHPSFADLNGLKVSSHFLIRRHGQLLQFVSVHDRAWHAGQSNFMGRQRCNDFSIGIELEGDLDRPFTKTQYKRLNFVVDALAQHLPIKYLAGHSDIAPGRKFDPGPRFDWTELHKVSAANRLKCPYGAGGDF